MKPSPGGSKFEPRGRKTAGIPSREKNSPRGRARTGSAGAACPLDLLEKETRSDNMLYNVQDKAKLIFRRCFFQ